MLQSCIGSNPLKKQDVTGFIVHLTSHLRGAILLFDSHAEELCIFVLSGSSMHAAGLSLCVDVCQKCLFIRSKAAQQK